MMLVSRSRSRSHVSLSPRVLFCAACVAQGQITAPGRATRTFRKSSAQNRAGKAAKQQRKAARRAELELAGQSQASGGAGAAGGAPCAPTAAAAAGGGALVGTARLHR